MKKKVIVSLSLVCVLALAVLVKAIPTSANSASFTFETESTSVKKENEFQVAVRFNSSIVVQLVEGMISYDPEVLEFIESEDEAVSGASGLINIRESFEEGTTEAVYYLTFKAIDLGDVQLNLHDIYVEEIETTNYIGASESTLALEVIENVNESREGRLSEILIFPGEIEFDPDIYEYEVEVDFEDELFLLSTVPMDEDSVVEVEMPEVLAYGVNLVDIQITALSGAVTNYTITVIRPSEPKESIDETEDETEDESIEDTEDETVDDTEDETDETIEVETVESTDDINNGDAEPVYEPVNE